MTDRLRVVVVGPGFIAGRHLAVLAAEEDVELVGILGRRPGPAAEAASRFGGRPYVDLERMLDQERPDAAWICVPPGSRGTLELAMVERGVHLFVEKPLAADPETPERISEAIDAAGLVAGVAYHWRAMDTLARVEDAIAGNPVRLVVGAWHDSRPSPAWWSVEAQSGGQVVEQATHLVDLSRRLVGEATVVAATADRYDRPGGHGRADRPGTDVAEVSTALLRYESGAVGAFTATCVLGGPGSREIRLLSDGLAITIDQQGVRYEDGRGSRFVPLGNDPFRDEDRAFLDAIRSGDRSRLFSRYDDALRTHRLTCAIREAARPG